MTATLPSTEVAAGVTAWLSEFGDALAAGDPAAAAGLFTEDCYWRDLVAFTWNIKTLEGRAAIAGMLDETLPWVQPGGWKITDGEEPAEAGGVIEAWIELRDRRRPRPRAPAAAGWPVLDAADHARTSSRATRNAAGRAARRASQHGADPARTTWLEDREQEAAELGVTRAAVRADHRRRPGGHRARRAAAPARRAHDHRRQARPPGRPVAQPLQVAVPARPGLVRPHAVPEVPRQLAGLLAQGQDRRLARVVHEDHGAQLLARYRGHQRGLRRGGRRVDGARSSGTASRSMLRPAQLVLATGMSGRPNLPGFPGMDTFRGDQHHSSSPPGPGRLPRQAVRGHRLQQLGLRHLRRAVGERRGRHHGAALVHPHRPVGHADGHRR